MRKCQAVVHKLHVLYFHKQRLGAPVPLHPWQHVILNFPEDGHCCVLAGGGHCGLICISIASNAVLMCLLNVGMSCLEFFICFKHLGVVLLPCTSFWCFLGYRLLSDVQCGDIFFYSVAVFHFLAGDR